MVSLGLIPYVFGGKFHYGGHIEERRIQQHENNA